MKQITYFYLSDCPFCAMADQAIRELAAENPEYASVEIDRIDEEQFPERTEGYDYYYVPSLFIGREKQFEAYFGIPFDEVKEGVRKALDAAL